MTEASTEPTVTLGELCTESVDQSGPKGEFVYIDISSIDREAKKIVDPKLLPLDKAPSRARQVLKAGDVLVSMTRPNLNAVALVPDHLDGAIGSTGFHVLRSRWLQPEFLLGLVQSQSFVDAMSALVQGALYPAVRPKDIAAYRFKFEVPAQQARIVAKLAELLSDLDAGVAELKAAQKKLQQYRQSLLKAAVEGALTADWRKAQRQQGTPTETGAQLLARILTERRARWEARQLAKFKEQGKAPPKDWQKKYPEPVLPDITDLPTLPEGWVWATIDQLSHSVRNGVSKTPNTEGRGHPILRINAVRPMSVSFDVFKHVELSDEETAEYSVEDGDLLATRYNGSVDLLGVVGLVREAPEKMLHPDKLIRIKPVLSVSLPNWIELAANTGVSRSHIVRRVKTTAGQTGISGEDLKKMPIPLPSLAEQTLALSMTMKRLEAQQDQDAYLATSFKQSGAQRQNILRAAFAGQLVPQDPNDESASTLLERIRTDRIDRASVPKARKRMKFAEA